MIIIRTTSDYVKALYLLVEIELCKALVELKTTHGFPIELSKDMVREKFGDELKVHDSVIDFFIQEHKDSSKNNKFKKGFKVVQ